MLNYLNLIFYKTVIIALIINLTNALPSYSAKCPIPKLARRYTFRISGNVFSPFVTLFAQVRGVLLQNHEAKLYKMTVSNIQGSTFNKQITQACSIITTNLPVVVNFDGVPVQLDYGCTGSINKSKFISGTCTVNEFVPELGTTVIDEAVFTGKPGL